MEFTYREARVKDIRQLQHVRHAVKENILSDPAKVTDALVEEYITRRGRGWVCEQNGRIVGFSIVDLQEDNVWALFILPEVEGLGAGKKLHDIMVHWFFSQGKNMLSLSTSPGTRAEAFYIRNGWVPEEINADGEVVFKLVNT